MKAYPEDTDLSRFASAQLSTWPLARENYKALKSVRTRLLHVGGLDAVLQYNPSRIISSSAKIDKESLAARKCFLCRENRGGDQSCIPFTGKKGKKYDVLLNPYPIFPRHFTIALSEHSRQSIWRRYTDMLLSAEKYSGYTIIYNGPECGASAPDHHHFQAVPRKMMPMEEAVLNAIANPREAHFIVAQRKASLYAVDILTSGVFVIKSESSKDAAKLFYRFLDCSPSHEGKSEPMINLLTFRENGCFYSIVFLRRKHRSHHYYAEGDENIFMSLGSVDMGGVFIASKEKDFEKVTSKDIEEILSEISATKEDMDRIEARMKRGQCRVSVGIMSGKSMDFRLLYDGAGMKRVSLSDGKILYDGMLYDELIFDSPMESAMFAEPSFELYGVEIGKGFHWNKKEDQLFAGALKFIVRGDAITAVNVIGVEDYLLSVISSEMNAAAPKEFLKAHAVISRSWLIARLRENADAGDRQGDGMPAGRGCKASACSAAFESVGEDWTVRWYDNGTHSGFDVCADDHCQRYQGLSRAVGNTVKEVIDETWGEILEYKGEICDARFSKCCGGMTELFSTCWDDKDYPYLVSKPDPYCNTSDQALLSSVLNDYDAETRSFYRWRVEYGADELSSIVKEKSGVDFGRILSLKPLRRGPSGRISLMRITGTKRAITVGKELEIRRWLSPTHLYSSAFDVEEKDGRFILSGKGWGHGVGLCQIGAAVMASEGAGYREILDFYYPGSSIKCCGEGNQDCFLEKNE